MAGNPTSDRAAVFACTALLAATPAFPGCRPDAGPPPQRDPSADAALTAAPTTQAADAPAGVPFASPEHGYRLTRPAGWARVPSADYELQLVPPGSGPSDARPVLGISVDVPDLPPHLPGFIPLGLVVNGYVDDLKKQYAGLKVEESTPTKLAGANARRVRTAWTAGGRAYAEDAVLAVHNDRVYILRLTADAAEYASLGPTFEAVLRSLAWEK